MKLPDFFWDFLEGIFGIGEKTYIDENGYRRFSDSDKLVSRWAVEKKLGRELDPDEEVHHKNRNKLDNRPENLEALTPEEHNRRHGQPEDYNLEHDDDYNDDNDDDYDDNDDDYDDDDDF